METESGTHDVAQLAAELSRWIDIVARTAGQRFSLRSASEREYQELHGNLLNHCQICAHDEAGPLCRKLAPLVQPWVTLETLRKADLKIVLDLLAKLQFIESRLTGKNRRRARRPPLALLIGIGLVVAILAFSAVATNDDWVNFGGMSSLRGMGLRLVRRLRSTTVSLRIMFVAVAVMIGGTLLLQGMRKS